MEVLIKNVEQSSLQVFVLLDLAHRSMFNKIINNLAACLYLLEYSDMEP